MKVSPIFVLMNLFLIGSVCDAAVPVVPVKESKMVSAIVKPVVLAVNNLECDACEFLAKELDEKVFHNDHLIELAQNELDNICNVLPTDAQDLCYAAVNNTVPELLGKIGDYVEEKGCSEIGVCKDKKIDGKIL